MRNRHKRVRTCKLTPSQLALIASRKRKLKPIEGNPKRVKGINALDHPWACQNRSGKQSGEDVFEM